MTIRLTDIRQAMRGTAFRRLTTIQAVRRCPTPKAIDFQPGALLGSVSGELGLRKFLEIQGHTFVVTSDKDGPDSVFERELVDAEVVISQPFWPAYLTEERIAKAKKLKLAITAGIGSDHVDLQAAMNRGITVAEVTYSNSISVSEHVVMMILVAGPQLHPVLSVGDQGRLEHRGLRRSAPTISKRWRSARLPRGASALRCCAALSRSTSNSITPIAIAFRRRSRRSSNVTFHQNVASMVAVCDVVTINAPLHPETENLFNETLIAKMKRGAYLVNTARGKICNRDAIARALESGQLAGYAGDVWFPQPPPKDHPWRSMPHHGMTPHISGSSLSAQARYAAGTREILECWFEGRPIRDEYLIVDGGKLAGAGAHSYSAGDATRGSEEAVHFRGKA